MFIYLHKKIYTLNISAIFSPPNGGSYKGPLNTRVVKQKTSLQTTIFSAHGWLLNFVNFGPQTAKNRTGVSTEQTRSRHVD